jgi:hypothetical protein
MLGLKGIGTTRMEKDTKDCILKSVLTRNKREILDQKPLELSSSWKDLLD